MKGAGSRQPGVFRPCLLDHRDLGVGVIPRCEKVVVGDLRFCRVARECVRSRQLQARHCVHRIDEHDTSMIDNALELGGGLHRLPRRQVREAANLDRIQLAEVAIEADAAQGEIEAGSRLQRCTGGRAGGARRTRPASARRARAGRHRSHARSKALTSSVCVSIRSHDTVPPVAWRFPDAQRVS